MRIQQYKIGVSKYLLLLLVVTIAVLPGLGNAQTIQPRIINGGPVPIGTYPWMASLHLAGSQPTDVLGGHSCGAFLIHPQYLLTSGHCVYGYRTTPTQLAATIGRTQLSSSGVGQTIGISSLLIHPSYNDALLDFDIAILKLATPVTSITPVKIIYPGAASVQAGTSGLILGWGTTAGGMTVSFYTDIMQQATIPVPPEATCVASMLSYFHPDNMLCAGRLATTATSGDGVDACYGDSGDPLLANLPLGGNRVVGVSSWGYDCASYQYYGVYARLDTVSSWIHANVPIPPAPLVSPSISGGLYPADTLTCDPGLWDGATNLFSYLFETETGTALNSGATATYQVKAGDVGKKIRCTVTDTSPGGQGSASSPYIGPIVSNATPTPTATATATRTATATSTRTATPTATRTSTPTNVAIATPTPTRTATPTTTATATSTVTSTPTRTATPTSTRTPTPTSSTLFTPTATPTRTATATKTATATPTTITTPTITPTATLTPTPVVGILDVRAPRVIKARKVCIGLDCQVTLEVADSRRGPSSGIGDLEIGGKWYGRSCEVSPTNPRRKICHRIESVLTFTQVSRTEGVFVYSFSVPMKGRYRGTARASDNSRNLSRIRRFSGTVRG